MSDPDFYIGKIENERFTLPSTTFLTHAAVLGASGSGKTVVCKSIVEEAIRASIPIIAVDPKGDIGALGIGLQDFSGENLSIHAQVEASDRGGDADEITNEWLTLYKRKLEESFGSEFENVEKDYSDRVAVILITPKNSAGVQISLTPVFERPQNYQRMMEESPDAVLSSLDLKIQLLLSRCGIGISSSTDNRVIFLNNLIRHFWEKKRKKTIGLAELIENIQNPPFEEIGSLSVEKFISNTKRSELARNINALMVRAIPGVELDFDKLINLAKKEGKVPIIIFDLRKITDPDEKSTFVAEILGEVQRWAWTKGGTSRLRAILYFDELYGFMPAGSLSPPSKTALLIILKQARAAGLGCILATQNPGDLDYRGLSNIATWVLGRLATNQDIAKVQGALKPVFEGAGGSEEDFRKLMNQIRALTPGNFIAYNPRYGVNRITTRWLLSLHKGPLTDNEIKHLTLKPPKPESKVSITPDKKGEPQKEIIESKISFTDKKLSPGKITERFLITRIPIEHIQPIIQQRLSISGNVNNDGFKLNISPRNLFYSPIFYSKTLINIKRSVKDGILNFPVEITEEMTRTYDLSRGVNWDATTIEGIHASSLPPTDLSLSPQDGYQFLELSDPDLLSKLPENLEWYFTQSPFPEAGNLYQRRLREYEHQTLEQLAGKKKSKEFSKVSAEIMRLEEKIETENQKLDTSISRIDSLKGEMKAREDEGRSIKAIERSLDSTENKMRKHEDKISELKKQLLKTEKQRQLMLKEHKEKYAEFHGAMDKLKAKGPPRDLYRPGKADISIIEKSIYWIPRALVPITLISDLRGESLKTNYLINLNLYNGNAELTCDGCGSQVSTENYYQALLANEISPPTFICAECLKMFCSEHISFCSYCGKSVCIDHLRECDVCQKGTCPFCSVIDTITHKILCKDDSWTCIQCGRSYNNDIKFLTDDLDSKPVCEECAPEYLYKCFNCGKVSSQVNFKICEGCKKAFCPEHMAICKKCNSQVCPDCGRVKVKIKNEEVIARCINCS